MRYTRQILLVINTVFVFGLLLPLSAMAQSRDQNFPTPVSSNEINGIIPARDIGDSRLTRYFYIFQGAQGDVFINVVSKNLSGDIDVFSADSMQPLTKIVLYSDLSPYETGRLIYLRMPTRLILRVEGRTPNDDPASFRIKFGGSFVAMDARETDDAPVVERSERETGIKVNSVGTIIEVLPKDEGTRKEKEAVKISEPPMDVQTAEVKEEVAGKPPKDAAGGRVIPAPEVSTVFGVRPARPEEKRTIDKPVRSEPTKSGSARDRRGTAEPANERAPDPLAAINLVILMKSGDRIERPMSEVVRFSVDKGVLTVVTRDGKTSRFSILTVERVTIQ